MAFIKKLKGEEGVALVTSLLLTLIALTISAMLLYMVTLHTQISGQHKRYRTAIDASYGAAEIFSKQVIPSLFLNHTTAGLAGQFASNYCLQIKLSKPTSDWGACKDSGTLFDPTKNYDMLITLPGPSGTNDNFQVAAKIVDTLPGNSDLSGYDQLDSGSGVVGVAAGVSPKHIPATYRIEVQGQKAVSPTEKSQLTVLYAY